MNFSTVRLGSTTTTRMSDQHMRLSRMPARQSLVGCATLAPCHSPGVNAGPIAAISGAMPPACLRNAAAKPANFSECRSRRYQTATLARNCSTWRRRSVAVVPTTREAVRTFCAQSCVSLAALAMSPSTPTIICVPWAALVTLREISSVAAFCCCTEAATAAVLWLISSIRGGDALDDFDHVGRGALQRRDLCVDLLRRSRGLDGERFDFGRDPREAPARFAGARGLDRGVERQQIGLSGDVLDQLHDMADLLGDPRETRDLVARSVRLGHCQSHDRRRCVELAADLG